MRLELYYNFFSSKLGKFSVMISLNKHSVHFTLSTLSGTPKIHKFGHLLISHRAQRLSLVFLFFLFLLLLLLVFLSD